MAKGKQLFIGAMASKVGVSVDTVRYYEKLGLLPRAQRTESGYRVYSPEDIARLSFIKRAQSFGFSLAEIGELLGAQARPASCARVLRVVDKKLDELGKKLEELRKLKRELSAYRRQCLKALKRAEACPVIEVISPEPDSSSKRS